MGSISFPVPSHIKVRQQFAAGFAPNICYVLNTYWHLWHTYLPRPTAFALALHSWHSARPWLRIKPKSANSLSHIWQRKQRGCQLEFMALITRPITNSPVKEKV